MKQGINFLLDVEIGTNLDDVEKIEFIFKQNEKELSFVYPSKKATRIDNNTIGLSWTLDETYMFDVGYVFMDTRITLNDSQYQPETEIVVFRMNKTLFKEENVWQ